MRHGWADNNYRGVTVCHCVALPLEPTSSFVLLITGRAPMCNFAWNLVLMLQLANFMYAAFSSLYRCGESVDHIFLHSVQPYRRSGGLELSTGRSSKHALGFLCSNCCKAGGGKATHRRPILSDKHEMYRFRPMGVVTPSDDQVGSQSTDQLACKPKKEVVVIRKHSPGVRPEPIPAPCTPTEVAAKIPRKTARPRALSGFR